MKSDSTQISLANFFIYNTDYGHKEGREAEKLFYYYPESEKIERKVRQAGFCAGMVRFAETFKSNKPCEFVHTDKLRIVLYQIDDKFWMVMSLNVPVNSSKEPDDDQIVDHLYMSILNQAYNFYKLFNGNIGENLERIGAEQLRLDLKGFFDDYLDKKLLTTVVDSNLVNTFNGIQFMSLDRSMYLKVQCLLNQLEEKVPLVEKTVVMHNDQLIWNGLEQDDIACIYNYLRDLVVLNLDSSSSSSGNSSSSQSQQIARFLVDHNRKNEKKLANQPTTSHAAANIPTSDVYFEFEKVYLGANSSDQYYLIPYNLSRLTVFIFIRVNNESFKLSLLKEIDDMLASSMLIFLQEIADSQLKINIKLNNMTNPDEKEIKYIYFNRLNLAQKTTIANLRDMPKNVINLLGQLSKDLRTQCDPCGEIFVKSGKDYWLACKKSDQREVYVVVSQKNANLTLIDEDIKQLCSTNFSNIFFME